MLPADWIDLGKEFGFDTFAVSARVQGDTLEISRVYDQAGKGRGTTNLFSAITLLNKLCTRSACSQVNDLPARLPYVS